MATDYNFFLTATEVQDKSTIKSKKSIASYKGFSFLLDYKSCTINAKEKQINLNLQMVSRVTTNGKIKFCNSDYIAATKYNGKELVNTKPSITTHPEMPKTIFKHVIKELNNGKDVIAITRHLDKNGQSFWLNTHFKPNNNENNLKIAYATKAVPTSKNALQKIKKIYNALFLIEKNVSEDYAQKYFNGMLEMEYANYEGLLLEVFR